MIIHYKEPIQNMNFYAKSPLQFSKDFTFIPLQLKGKQLTIKNLGDSLESEQTTPSTSV